MGRKIFLLCELCVLCGVCVAQNIVFTGASLAAYKDSSVVFDQTLYVCGRYGHTMYLSYERLRAPEEVSEYGTAAYDSVVSAQSNALLTAYCPYIYTDTVRLGTTITGLRAEVTDERAIKITENIVLSHNTRCDSILM